MLMITAVIKETAIEAPTIIINMINKIKNN